MKIGGQISTDGLSLLIDPNNQESSTYGSPTVNLFDSMDLTQLENVGNYIHFSGSYISQTGIYNYDQTSTIDIWFKANSEGKFPIAGYDMNTTGGGFSATVAGMVYRNGTVLSFAIITSDQAYRFANCIPNFEEIINVSAVKNMESGEIKIYLNGEWKNTVSFNTGSFAKWFTPPQDMASQNIFSIGHTNSTHSSWEDSDFNLYSLRLYSKELSASNIKDNYNNMKGRYGS